MFYFVKQVGTNFGIYDSDDGTIEWITKQELLEYSKKVAIAGVSDGKPQSCTIESNKCNLDNGRNIFKTCKSISINNKGDFAIITTSGRKYSGKLYMAVDNTYYMQLNCNIFVRVCEDIIQHLCSQDANMLNQVVNIFNQYGDKSLSSF